MDGQFIRPLRLDGVPVFCDDTLQAGHWDAVLDIRDGRLVRHSGEFSSARLPESARLIAVAPADYARLVCAFQPDEATP